jgi:hypothetical protein
MGRIKKAAAMIEEERSVRKYAVSRKPLGPAPTTAEPSTATVEAAAMSTATVEPAPTTVEPSTATLEAAAVSTAAMSTAPSLGKAGASGENKQ